MKIIQNIIKRPISVIMVYIGFMIFGLIALYKLEIDILPPIQYPELSIITLYEGASPTEIEELITKKIEETVGGVNGLKRIYSESIEGASLVRIVFTWDTDIDLAMINLREKVDQAKGLLPQDAEKPIVTKFNPASKPIIEMTIKSKVYDTNKLKNIAEKKIKPFFERINGIGNVKIIGGQEREILISVDSKKMYAYSLSVEEIKNKVIQSNYNMPAGYININDKEILIRTIGEFKTLEDIKETTIKISENGGKVKIKDVAEVIDSFEDLNNIAIINGEECIGLSLIKESGKNTVKVSEEVISELSRLKEKYAGEIEFNIHYDGSQTIKQSVNGVSNSAILGAIIASIIIFIFLGNFLESIAIVIVIPVSLVITMFFMYLQNISLNIMSLGGLALGTGMLVDNGIVIVESINRKIGQLNNTELAIIEGVDDVKIHLFGSMITTLVVFLPLLFLKGIIGIIFFQLAFTISIAQIISYIMAITFIPSYILLVNNTKSNKHISKILLFIDRFKGKMGKGDALYSKLENMYLKRIDITLKNIKRSIIYTILILVISGILLYTLRVEFIPKMDNGYFIINVNAEKGTPIDETLNVIKYIDSILEKESSIDKRFCRIGLNPKDITEYFGKSKSRSTGELHVFLKSNRSMKTDEFINYIKDKILVSEKIKIDYEPVNIISTLFEFIKNDNIFYTITESDNDLFEFTELLKNNKEIEKNYEIDYNSINRDDELLIVIDKVKMASNNVSAEMLSNMLSASIKGEAIGFYYQLDDQVPIKIRYERKDRKSIDSLLNMMIKNEKGELVYINSFISIDNRKGYQKIIRNNQKRIYPLSFFHKVNSKKDIIREIKESVLKNINNVEIDYPEEYYEMKESSKEFIISLILSIILVYMVLASQFESVTKPFLIMSVIPLSAIGIFVSLKLTGNTINIVSVMGMIMLVGIVVNNAIVLLGKMDDNIADGLLLKDSVYNACKERVKPILMTSITTILGATPLAFSSGQGEDLQTPLGITVIGGFVFSTFIVLYLLPTFYYYTNNKNKSL